MDNDLVLGVAVAPAALSLVLVREPSTDGLVLDADYIRTAAPVDRARGAIMRTYSTAVKHGYRIRGVGVTSTGGHGTDVAGLVQSLRYLGVRNVMLADDTGSPASTAAAHALDMVRSPVEAPTPTASGRHRQAAPRPSRRLALSGAAIGVLTAAAATLVVHATFGDSPAMPPNPAAVRPEPAANPTPVRTTRRSVFVGSAPERRTPAETITPITAPVSVPEPESTPDPAPVVTEHLPDAGDGPRLPGPAE